MLALLPRTRADNAVCVRKGGEDAGFKISRAGGGLSPAKEDVITPQERDYHAYECASEACRLS